MPLPTPDTTPMARSASGTRRFTNVDLPTPECPSSTVSLPRQQRLHRVQRIVAAGGDDGEVQIGELRGERLRRRQVGLGQAQDRRQPAGVGGDQRPLDEAGARRRVGQRHHDQQLVGVGDHHPLGGIGVIGGAPQHRSAFGPRRTIRARVSVRPDRSPTMSTSSPTTIGVRPSSRARIAVTSCVRVAAEHAAPAAAVDGHHHGRARVGVLGTGLGARSRALARADPDVGLVVVATAAHSSGPAAATPGPPACPPTARGTPAASWRWWRCRRPRRPGTRKPDDRAGHRHPVIGIGVPGARRAAASR